MRVIRCSISLMLKSLWSWDMENVEDRYTFRVTWSEEDGEYVATVAEMPSLSWLAATPEAALGGARRLVAEVAEELVTSGEVLPVRQP
jgi:predicted RNase H-like HicB family nuclease